MNDHDDDTDDSTLDDPHTPTPAGPYAATAPRYHAAGWSPLPLPHGRKTPVPTGYTGTHGTTPSYPDVHAWADGPEGHGNIALRLPPDVIGIDVDHYDAKPGGAILAMHEDTHGPLPPTWRSTARDDGVSGIRLYRVPPGLRWPGGLGPGIDTVRHDHRYALAWPSVHPAGGTYRWITPDGATALDAIPAVDDLPDLPEPWVAHFTGGELSTDTPRSDLTTGQAHDWLTRHGTGHPCPAIIRATLDGLTALNTATSRHDHTLQLTNRLLWRAAVGHPGAATALDQVRTAFLAATGADRAHDDAAAEWDRMIVGGIRRADPQVPPGDGIDPCTDPTHGLIDRSTPPCPDPAPTTPTTSPTPSPASQTPPNAQPTPSPVSPPAPTSPSAPAPADTTTPATATPAPDPDTTASHDASTTHPAADTTTALDLPPAPAGITPDLWALYYPQEVARTVARQAAARHVDHTHDDDAVADRVHRRLLDDRAATAYRLATEPPAPPFDAGTLTDILARPADPPARVDGLMPWEGSTLIVAQRKTGKTTMLLNLARSLLTGDPFLGEFPVIPLEPHQCVAFLNYEVSGAQLARWAADTGVDPDRMYLVNLRGRRNPLGHPDDRAHLAATLRDRNVASLIVDPFGRAYTGLSQNDNGEVQSFLVDLDMFARAEVGATDLMLATHAGWDGERSRGASALEDWGDTIITLTREDTTNSDDEPRRFMRAIGRDVDIDEDEITIDPATRTLTRAGTGSRRTVKSKDEAGRLGTFVIRAARENPGCSKNQLRAAIEGMYDAPDLGRGGRGEARLKSAIERAEQQGFLRVDRPGSGQANRHYESDGPTSISAHVSHHTGALPGSGGTAPTTPWGGGGGPGGAPAPTTPARREGFAIDLATGEVLQ